ncbi:MAG TPA: hypothetical protein VFO19_20450 [Vicinamibacterales bacterium]|nr:hypothetical protein [Vicinamibacterales bacterium]
MNLFVAFAMIFLAAPAQTGANFAGTWAMERSATGGGSSGSGGAMGGGAVAGGMSGGGGAGAASTGASNGMRAGGGSISAAGGGSLELVVTQTATALTMERRFPGVESQTTTYKLDGSESINTTGRATLKTKSRWEGAKLVTEGTQVVKTEQAEIKGTIKETRWLEKDGTMVVETVRQIDGGAASTITQTFKKK